MGHEAVVTRPARKIEAHLADQIRDGQRTGYRAGALPATGLGRMYVARHLLDLGWRPPENAPVRPESPFSRRMRAVGDELTPVMLLVFIAMVVVQAIGDLSDGVDGIADWLALVIVAGTAGLVLLFGRVLLMRWRRGRR